VSGEQFGGKLLGENGRFGGIEPEGPCSLDRFVTGLLASVVAPWSRLRQQVLCVLLIFAGDAPGRHARAVLSGLDPRRSWL
jgi:hypothetical protein